MRLLIAALLLCLSGAEPLEYDVEIRATVKITPRVAPTPVPDDPVPDPDPVPTPDPEPTPDGLLQPDDPKLIGLFRMPRPTGTATAVGTFDRGGGAPAIRPSTGHLWLTGKGGHAELKIPVPVKSDVMSELPIAEAVQPIGDLTGGMSAKLDEERHDMGLSCLAFIGEGDGERALLGYTAYYDADYSARSTHSLSHPSTTAPEPVGAWRIGETNPGDYGGFLIPVPPEWQERGFKPMLCGSSQLAIIGSRSSTGPAAYGFDPADFDTAIPWTTEARELFPDGRKGPYKPATEAPEWVAVKIADQVALGARGGTVQQDDARYQWVRYQHVRSPVETYLNYPEGDATRYAQPSYANGPTINNGVFFPNGIVFIGWRRTGEIWYGGGTSPNGANDPCSSNYGVHGEGKEAVLICYDPAELLRVKRGEAKPWEIRPLWTRVLDDHPSLRDPCVEINGTGYGNRLYVVVRGGERVRDYGRYPLVLVYEVR